MDSPRLLYFSPASRGGLAEYAHEQANALARAGVEVALLCTPEFYPSHRGAEYALVPELRELASARPWRLRAARAARYATLLLADFAVLRRAIARGGYRHVLFGSYFELLAPLWSAPLRRLARGGVAFGTVVHDPVREARDGPGWLHEWSVDAAYSFVREAFVHEESHLELVPPRPGLRATVIPQGIYGKRPSSEPREAVRARLGIPPQAPLLLSFGYVRDGKNLDLVIRAMAAFPEVHLLVTGREMSSADRPLAEYRRLAEETGVAGRCRWIPDFVPEEEVGNLFAAADVVLLTYSAGFVSASAVANTAANYRKPVLASSGNGWLRSVVERYGLGVWVQPDSVSAIEEGLRRWLAQPPLPDWERYAAEHSWDENARIVAERMGLLSPAAAEPPAAPLSAAGAGR